MTDIEIAKRLVRTEHSASSRGKEFNMTFKKMKALLSTKTCYITGVELQTEDEKADNYLTLERLDNEQGYIDSNVVACSSYINKKKGDLTVQEVKDIYNAMKKKKIL
tara:strand:+ start:1558 stop:1878 length:321 start_codon:yes stop_codon:yes gene_type:complete